MEEGLPMVTVNGYAKINLLLDILGQREDGYHEIATVMQSLALADTLTFTKQETGITLTVDLPGLEADERNLAYRAAALLMRECGVRGGVHIRIDKRIPVAAGLAGGSADAAAALRGVNELYALGQSDAELCRLGAQIGSDVPFSLMGGNLLLVERWRGKLQWSLRAQRALAMIPFSISQIMDVQVHKLVWKRKIRLVIEEKH